MNILVYDVAAENGGATSILEYFYSIHKQDTENKYFYILSTYVLEETENIKVINVPQVKKSWLHRLHFDYFGVKKYLKQFAIDEVFSLQNTRIPCFRGKQTVYLHNALPFSEHRFSFGENKKLWIYQNVIGKMMKNSAKKADKTIVQTEWMKEAVEKAVPKAVGKVEVQFPKVDVPAQYTYQGVGETCRFFYPANSEPFKNHRLILEACRLLKGEETPYEVVLTLVGDEAPWIAELKQTAEQEGLPFRFIGRLTREEVLEWYTRSVLLFPSYIETVGLPIYEAKTVGAPMLLSDCAYARGVAQNYEKAQYFNYKKAEELSALMKEIMKKEAKE